MITLIASFLLLAAPGPNAYQLQTQWRAEDGSRVTLAQFAGQPVLLTFVYTSCGATCPLTTKAMQRLEKKMLEQKKSARIVVVSLDPAQDTPEAVRAYRGEHGLTNNPRWNVLVGDDAELRKLTMLLDFRFSKNPESGAIMHDNKIYLLSKTGEVLVVSPSLEEDQAALLGAIKRG